LTSLAVEPADRVDHRLAGVAAVARVQQPPEGALVVLVLVDVRDAQLGLPQKRVVRTLEDLPLLGDRRHDGLQRRAPIHVAEASTLDLAHDLPDAAPDRAEVLQALFPQEPGAVRRMGIGLPTVDQGVPLRGRGYRQDGLFHGRQA
jgi:hypothetical protein